MNFNFCKFYNKTMNAIEDKDAKIIPEVERRKNVKEISIILGIIYIILSISCSIFIRIIFILWDIYKFIHKILKGIYGLTVSKCDIQK